MNNSLPGQLTYAHDVIGMIHTVFLYCVYSRIYITTATVKIGGMHVDHQRLTRYLFGMQTGRICQPIVWVYDIKLLLTGYHAGHNGIIIDLFMQIVRITPREFDASQVICMQIIEIGINMIT